MFVQITYDSRAHAPILDTDIADISMRSIRNNISNGLTSFIYYDDWRFLHILEGRPEQVADTMKRITESPLHHSLKVRLMNRGQVRSFPEWPFGTLAATDPVLHRIMKNMGFRDLFQANVLDAIKVLKRTAGRKYRMMNPLEKQALADPRMVTTPKSKPNLTEEILGLRR
jgi:uncharacterized protein YwbE